MVGREPLGCIWSPAQCWCRFFFSPGNEIESGFDLGMDYYNFTSPIVDGQLAKGGIRLAYLLNNVFSGAFVLLSRVWHRVALKLPGCVE
jgi:S1/P1 Nuclease